MPLVQVTWKSGNAYKQHATVKRRNQNKLQSNLFDSSALQLVEEELRDVDARISESNELLKANQTLLIESQKYLSELSECTAKMVYKQGLFVQEIEMQIARVLDGIGIAREFSVRDSALLKDLSLAWDVYLSQK